MLNFFILRRLNNITQSIISTNNDDRKMEFGALDSRDDEYNAIRFVEISRLHSIKNTYLCQTEQVKLEEDIGILPAR